MKIAETSTAAKLGVLTLTALLMAGCNTVSGAGQDVQAAGTAIDREARQVRDD